MHACIRTKAHLTPLPSCSVPIIMVADHRPRAISGYSPLTKARSQDGYGPFLFPLGRCTILVTWCPMHILLLTAGARMLLVDGILCLSLPPPPPSRAPWLCSRRNLSCIPRASSFPMVMAAAETSVSQGARLRYMLSLWSMLSLCYPVGRVALHYGMSE